MTSTTQFKTKLGIYLLVISVLAGLAGLEIYPHGLPEAVQIFILGIAVLVLSFSINRYFRGAHRSAGETKT